MRSESEPIGQKERSFIEEARRRQIIAAAVDVLAEVGYGNASLARIAKQAGISKGVISYHFDGKDDLMYQVVVQLYVAGGEYMAPLIQAAEGHRAKLLTYIQSNLRFIAEHTKHLAALTDVVLNFRNPDGSLRFANEDGESRIITPLIDLLEAGQNAGAFGEFDARSMAMLLRDAIDGAAQRAIRGTEFDIDRHAAQMCALFDRATRTNALGEGEDP